MLSIIGETLKAEGYSRRGKYFYLRRGRNWGVFQFQSSVKSSSEEVIFTINLGVFSGGLDEFFSTLKSGRPSIESCHWNERIGFLLPDPHDKWWVLTDDDSVRSLVTEEVTRTVISAGLPAIETHISDERLCEVWLTGKAPGLTTTERLVYLSVFLKAKNDVDDLRKVVQELRTVSQGKATESMAERHIQRLQSWKTNE